MINCLIDFTVTTMFHTITTLLNTLAKFPFQSQTANILCKENTYLTPVINQGLAYPILRLQNTEQCPEQNAPGSFTETYKHLHE